MRIKKITVQGWKSFADIEFELAHINVIVGRNSSGKSALLRAAQFLQPGGPPVPIGDIRLGADEAQVQFVLQNYDVRRYSAKLANNTVELEGPDGSRILPEISVEAKLPRPEGNSSSAACSSTLPASAGSATAARTRTSFEDGYVAAARVVSDGDADRAEPACDRPFGRTPIGGGEAPCGHSVVNVNARGQNLLICDFSSQEAYIARPRHRGSVRPSAAGFTRTT
ncbi:AAA family ATPase [Catenulispora sp. NL8]|uniref:AAA family ATPase n=1 Tax=Catenulispora pinistramenti TaxID=2705254 RepID=A0ABS5KY33_9ACTN|nr:AAA family ATPase [Catenulispora pinistramenti]MBS2550874.1 AAA family ATPase [Catenulispora pinistramenti]